MRNLTVKEMVLVYGAGEGCPQSTPGSIQDSQYVGDNMTALYKQAVAKATDLIEWVANQF